MDLEARIQELEIRIAHQEYTLQSQEAELLRLQQANQLQVRQLRELAERIRALDARGSADPAHEPPPPHY